MHLVINRVVQFQYVANVTDGYRRSNCSPVRPSNRVIQTEASRQVAQFQQPFDFRSFAPSNTAVGNRHTFTQVFCR